MSTRCTVTYLDVTAGEYHTVYGHLDGYLAGVGKTLAIHYNDKEKVKALIDEGSFSSLGATIDTTCFYVRDRGEAYELNKPTIAKNIEDILTQEYNYLFNGMYWFYFGRLGTDDYSLKVLNSDEINADNKERHGG